MFKKLLPLTIFILFSLLIVKSLLFYAPSWGLVDDFQNLETAKLFWSGGDFFKNFMLISFSGGYFRPVWHAWNLSIYHIFRDMPLMAYLAAAIFNFINLLLWGFLLNRIWSEGKKNKNTSRDIFLYPLTFFIFTPFLNNFMYISIQQKFIIFFSALSIYFFNLGYVKEKKIYFIYSVLAILLSILSHPTAVFLNLAMLILSLVIFFFTKKKNLIFNFILNLILFIPYLSFTLIFQLKGAYTSKYSNNFSNLLANFMSTSLSIRILTFLAVFYFCYLAILMIRNKNRFPPVFLIIPLSIICFVITLAPWGFPNYHLSVLTPFIMGMFFPFYSFLNSKYSILKISVNSCILILVLLVLFFIWFPRISKISDIKKTEQFIIDFEKNRSGNVYFMPFPCMEACSSLGNFTKTEMIYLSDSLLSEAKLRKPGNNFVILRDECPAVHFDGVGESEEIYRNNTWRIFRVSKKDGIRKDFKATFFENPIERIKTYLKK